jgi:DNA-binding transcriptional MocR family regulator
MDATARARLVEIARRHGLLIIEDASYAYLVEQPPPPIAALAPDITVYVSGLSKSVATGLRVGFASLARQRISVSTAEPFATSAQVPQAVRLALGSAELDGLRQALSVVREVVDADAYG